MARPKKLEFTALFGLCLQVVFVLVCMIMGSKSGSRAATAVAWYGGAGVLVWFLVLVHGRQRRLAREEREELEELRQTRLSEEIFEDTELDRMRASSGLAFFERFLVPLFSILISAALLYFAYRIGYGMWQLRQVEVQIPAHVTVAMVFIAFAGFLIGKYSAGLAQSRGFRLLRAAGGYVLGNVIGAVLVAIATAMYYFEVTWGEAAATYVIAGIMALVGLEILLNLVLDVYRPRVAGEERRPPYDSRILGLFAEPGGVLKTVAATLDYQFGFKVSETWFYRFMERAILPIVLVQVLSLWLLSCIVVVEQDEVVFLEKFCKPYVSAEDRAKGLPATALEPGFYFKGPWPFVVARHVPAYRVHEVELGKIKEPAARRTGSAVAHDDIILWRELHIDEDVGHEINFLVPSTDTATDTDDAEALQALGGRKDAPQVNLARLLAHVHYRVERNADNTIDAEAAFTHEYRQTDMQEHVERLGYRALCRVAASQDFIQWLSEDRGESIRRFEELVKEGIEREGLELDVIYSGIPLVHPPQMVAGSYEDVVTSLEKREALAYQGEQMAYRIVYQAEGQAAETKYDAEGYAAMLRATAAAERDQFLAQLEAYRRAPDVYRTRTYLDYVEQALQGQKLFVVPRTSVDVQIIDETGSVRPSILDLDMEG